MALYKRGQVWWLDAAIGDGRVRRSLATTDRTEAERQADLLVRAPGSLSQLDEALTGYRAYCVARRAKKTNATCLGYLAATIAGMRAKVVADLTLARASDYLTARAHAGAAPKTLNHIRAELRLFVHWLMDRGVLHADPLARLKAWRVPAPTIRHLSPEDIEAMRKAVTGDIVEPVALCLLWAGLRRGEAVWLDWKDVDLVRGLIGIRAKDKWQPKTRRNRAVPIAPKLRAVLEGFPRAAPWVFSSPTGLRWDPDNLTSRFRHLMVEAGLPWTLLDLRRTFGSHVIRRPGMSYARLAAIMGNSAAVCARHYAHVAPEETAVEDVAF